jgi:hypothetical protein
MKGRCYRPLLYAEPIPKAAAPDTGKGPTGYPTRLWCTPQPRGEAQLPETQSRCSQFRTLNPH